jgi:preprotein translocase subunit SecD
MRRACVTGNHRASAKKVMLEKGQTVESSGEEATQARSEKTAVDLTATSSPAPVENAEQDAISAGAGPADEPIGLRDVA